MVNFLTKSLSLEIVNFVSHLKERLGRNQSAFTKSAFIQARNKVSPDVFLYLIKRLNDEFYTDNSNVKLILNDFRVLAVDGTCITLPTTKELEDLYGKSTNQNQAYSIQARASVLYDLSNRMALNSILSHIDIGERELALQQLSHCKKGDLVIYDRGIHPMTFFMNTMKRMLLLWLEPSLISTP